MTRTGKIARLPRQIRDQLNRRLEDGQYGPKLLEWLNSLPEVQSALDGSFGSRPVTEKILSDWKQGGYEDWLRRHEKCEMVRNLAEEAWDLDTAAGGATVNDRLCRVLSAELAALAPLLLSETKDVKEKLRLLAGLLGEADRLRERDQKDAGLLLARERWDIRQERLLEEAAERKVKKEQAALTAPIRAAVEHGPLATYFGGGEKGGELAALFLEIQHGLKQGTLPWSPTGDQDRSDSAATGAGESNGSSSKPPDLEPLEGNGR
jgi:hypothetical protein